MAHQGSSPGRKHPRMQRTPAWRRLVMALASVRSTPHDGDNRTHEHFVTGRLSAQGVHRVASGAAVANVSNVMRYAAWSACMAVQGEGGGWESALRGLVP